ncbi:MAG: hypothetical protein QM817_24660 [Archangium sp.]
MSLECEDVEVELSGGGPVSDAARAHLETCESCRGTAKLLGLATLPPLSDAERMLLSGLAATTQRAWRDQQARPSSVRRFGSLALAAGLGALLASGLVMKLMPVPEPRIETRTELVATPVLPELAGEEIEDFNLSDDDVFFEVGWPSPTEGDL